MTMKTTIYTEQLNDAMRLSVPAMIFGAVDFALKVEPMIFSMAGTLSDDYQGGYWEMYSLSNGGFFMAARSACLQAIASPNGYTGSMTAEGFGITVCLFTYSHLSFGRGPLAEVCANHYHHVREFAMGHHEGVVIRACID